jgi:hypothetical protein
MSIDTLSVEFGETLATVESWLNNYIRQPHSQIGRVGPVCPFVEPSQRADTLETRVRLVGATPSLHLITEIIRCSLDEFKGIKWKASNPNLRALLVVLPDLPSRYYNLLDEAHAAVKSESVRQGIMIGQFHEHCQEKAARNPHFEVSKSPVPLLAVRLMAVHDVLFLTDKREWFEEYAARFGARYRNTPNGLDPTLYELYWKAYAKYGDRM